MPVTFHNHWELKMFCKQHCEATAWGKSEAMRVRESSFSRLLSSFPHGGKKSGKCTRTHITSFAAAVLSPPDPQSQMGTSTSVFISTGLRGA